MAPLHASHARLRVWLEAAEGGVVDDYTGLWLMEALRGCGVGYEALTPLYRVSRGRIEALYARLSRGRLEAPRVEPGDTLFFELYGDGVALAECLSLGLRVGRLTLSPVRIEHLRVDTQPSDRLRVILASPLVVRRGPLLPSPRVVLGAAAERLGVGPERLEEWLSPSHAALETVSVAWLVFGGDVLPGLIGYIVYYVEDPAAWRVAEEAALRGSGWGRDAGLGVIWLREPI